MEMSVFLHLTCRQTLKGYFFLWRDPAASHIKLHTEVTQTLRVRLSVVCWDIVLRSCVSLHGSPGILWPPQPLGNECPCRDQYFSIETSLHKSLIQYRPSSKTTVYKSFIFSKVLTNIKFIYVLSVVTKRKLSHNNLLWFEILESDIIYE